MGLEFKHFVYITAFACAIWALAVSMLFTYEASTEGIQIRTELAQGSPVSPFQYVDKIETIYQTLNVVLPLGALCILFLVYTHATNPVGFGGLALLLVLFMTGSLLVMDKSKGIEDFDGARLAQMVWWMQN